MLKASLAIFENTMRQFAHRKISSGTQLRRQNMVVLRVGIARWAMWTFALRLLHNLGIGEKNVSEYKRSSLSLLGYKVLVATACCRKKAV